MYYVNYKIAIMEKIIMFMQKLYNKCAIHFCIKPLFYLIIFSIKQKICLGSTWVKLSNWGLWHHGTCTTSSNWNFYINEVQNFILQYNFFYHFDTVNGFLASKSGEENEILINLEPLFYIRLN